MCLTVRVRVAACVLELKAAQFGDGGAHVAGCHLGHDYKELGRRVEEESEDEAALQ